MPNPDVVRALSGTSTVLGLLAGLAYLFLFLQAKRAERSIRTAIDDTEPLFNADQIVRILAEFGTDEARLQALQHVMDWDRRKAEAFLAKVKGGVSVTQLDRLGRRHDLSRLAAIGLFLFVLGLLGLLSTQQKPPTPAPSDGDISTASSLDTMSTAETSDTTDTSFRTGTTVASATDTTTGTAGTTVSERPEPQQFQDAFLDAAMELTTAPANRPIYGSVTSHTGRDFEHGLQLALRVDSGPSVVAYKIPRGARTFRAVVGPFKNECVPGGGVVNGWIVRISGPTKSLSCRVHWNYGNTEVAIPVEQVSGQPHRNLLITLDPDGSRTCDHAALGEPYFSRLRATSQEMVAPSGCQWLP